MLKNNVLINVQEIFYISSLNWQSSNIKSISVIKFVVINANKCEISPMCFSIKELTHLPESTLLSFFNYLIFYFLFNRLITDFFCKNCLLPNFKSVFCVLLRISDIDLETSIFNHFLRGFKIILIIWNILFLCVRCYFYLLSW